jgi:hypothetical protein
VTPERSLVRVVAVAVGRLVREALHQRWFVDELRAVGEIAACRSLCESLFQVASGQATEALQKAGLGWLTPVAAALLTGLGSRTSNDAWEHFFMRSYPKLVPAEFKDHLPKFATALNVFGWSAEVVAHFVRGLPRVPPHRLSS